MKGVLEERGRGCHGHYPGGSEKTEREKKTHTRSCSEPTQPSPTFILRAKFGNLSKCDADFVASGRRKK